jgi:ATP-dependent helicase/nuclease subunit B
LVANAFWLEEGTGLVSRMRQALTEQGLIAGQAVVLVPYAQLMVTARRYWARACPDGFSPRFETTLNWARTLGLPEPQAEEITLDVAHDVLTAHALLQRAGLGEQASILAPGVVEAAHQLLRCAGACLPAQRGAWAEAARAALVQGMDEPVLAYEAACARLALEWALASTQVMDVLLTQAVPEQGLLVVLEGFQADALTEALARRWEAEGPGRVLRLNLPELWAQAQVHAAKAPVAGLHPCSDAEDEAERAAAVVMQCVQSGQVPVALVATDRALTRRISAMLAARQVPLRDESGWKLSTTRAAAHVMGLLRAGHWSPSTDAMLDWLKSCPAWPGPLLQRLEQRLRREGVRQWGGALGELQRSSSEVSQAPLSAEAQWLVQVEAVRAQLAGRRTLGDWLQALRTSLQASGQWALLLDDLAGEKLLSVLRLDEAVQDAWVRAWGDSIWATRRLDLAEFTAWVHQALESSSFMADELPVYIDAQVVVLPMSQLLARPWAAVVMPGCDELRLPASPEPPGAWSSAQRKALGLPLRETLQHAQAQAFNHALQQPGVHVLWRLGDEGGEPLLASPLVQSLKTQSHGWQEAPEPRSVREVALQPVKPPLPRAQTLTLQRLSASAYEDLRRCPYRFFAMRLLDLREADELESEISKREFGLWLHDTLKGFHDALAESGETDREARVELINRMADAATLSQGLQADEFLPFAAVWPQVREGYLDWLEGYERTEGGSAVWTEKWLERALPEVLLVGQLDRLDRLRPGEQGQRACLVLDYKTEPLQRSKDRLKDPTEDTQLAFYAALLDADEAAVASANLRAAYVNVGEGGKTELVEQLELASLRDQLLQGISQDLQRIRAGATLSALGEGSACDFCGARGLCRKDFWS